MDLQRTLADAVGHHKAGRLAEAEASYRAVLRASPDQADALHLLGVLSHQKGDAVTAEMLIRRAIAANPSAPMFYNNLGKVLAERGDAATALASYREAVALAPDYAEAHYNLGLALQDAGDYVAAEAAYRRARELAPQLHKVAHNLGVVLMGQGRPSDAVAELRRALELKPDDVDTGRVLLQAILYDPAPDEATRFAEHEQFERRFATSRYSSWQPHPNARDPKRRLRIGWLSSDLRDHPVARNLQPILANRDRARFEAICYADVPKPDATTAAFQALADEWRPIDGRSDADAADLIRADRIDMLMVLAGRFDRNRPLVAAYRPAPIQIAFNDQATSGLRCMDYLIADRIVAPRHTRERFTERVLHLPSFYVHAPLDAAPPVNEPPALKAGYVTFGSFNNPAKIHDQVLDVWAGAMRRVPGSRLFLKYRNRFAPLRDRVLSRLAAAGISGERLDTGEQAVAYSSQLALYGGIDIALDPFPYAGSTTTFEALWMGVPVITLAGANMVSRWTASMLHAVGLDELVAVTADEYVNKVVDLANDPPRLAELRRTLRARVAASPLCDGQRRARQVERLLRAVWCRWCSAGPA